MTYKFQKITGFVLREPYIIYDYIVPQDFIRHKVLVIHNKVLDKFKIWHQYDGQNLQISSIYISHSENDIEALEELINLYTLCGGNSSGRTMNDEETLFTDCIKLLRAMSDARKTEEQI